MSLHISVRKEDDGTYTPFLDFGVKRDGFTYDRNGRRVLDPTYTVGLNIENIDEAKAFWENIDLKDKKTWVAKAISEYNKV